MKLRNTMMKKSILKGAAVLVLGGLTASCSHDEFEYSSVVEQKVKTYEATFKEVYGKIDPAQTWGFDYTNVTTRGAYPNANNWGTQGVTGSEQPYIVPQPLTDAQKDKVRRWFQQHKNPQGTAIHYTDFFVQQVYKGHTNLDGANSDCLEEYTAGNNTTVIGSNQMDYLTAGLVTYADNTQGYDHIYNYNGATYSGGAKNIDVWDGTLTNPDDWNSKVYHSDQIMLMMQSSTESFGFHSSQGSVEHHNKYVIIPGDIIQQWDTSLTDASGENADVSGMWFVGFDYEALLENDTQTNKFCIYPNTADSPNAVEIANTGGMKAVIGAADGYYSDWIVRITPGILKGSVNIPVDQGEVSDDRTTIVTTVYHYESSQLVEQGRVFCEDLGKITTNDLDFNDAVFDAYIYRVTPVTRTVIAEDGELVSDISVNGTPFYRSTIVLLAAGGTLPLSIAGSYEVHDVLGNNATNTIINTITDASGAYRNVWTTHDPVVLGTNFSYSSIVEIPVRVLYSSGETLELTAAQGWAPHKILVPIGTKWAKERVNIANAYTNFLDYVGSSQNFWEGNIVTANIYSHPADTYQPLATGSTTLQLVSTEGPTTTYRDNGSTTSGGYEGETVLSRRR